MTCARLSTHCRWFAGACLLMLAPHARAAISCSVTATDASLNYEAPSPRDITASATLRCTRGLFDALSVNYRVKATDGLNVSATSPYRRTALASPSSYLFYSLRRGSACNDATDWRAPATGTTNVQTGTLNFSSWLSFSITTTLPYCVRVRVNTGGNPELPSPGTYTDTFELFAQYSDDSAYDQTSAYEAVAVSVVVPSQCSFNTYPGTLNFNYTAFRTTPQTASTSFMLRCNQGMPWSVSVSPNVATLLGLQYQIGALPASGTGNGITGQAVTLTGTMPAGQAGTCSSPTCTANQSHTVFINY